MNPIFQFIDDDEATEFIKKTPMGITRDSHPFSGHHY